MDKYEITINAYDKHAKAFQDKFMDMDLYNASYELFCQSVKKKGAKILEIACGPGNITRYMLNKRPDFDIIGIDLAPKMIELAKENVPAASFRQMDCRKINAFNEKFDAIMCGFCLPYLSKEETAALITDCYKLLNHNGIIYISTMEGSDHKSGFEKTSFTEDDEIYIFYHQEEYLNQLFKAAGFKEIQLSRQKYPESDGSFTVDMIYLLFK